MPHPDQHRPPLAARRPTLSLVAPAEPTNADLLRAIESLGAKVDQLMAGAAPSKFSLMLGPDEIARTMAQLRIARPVKRM